jgi:uncharacterized membrane protein YciS (DUF1049 family)
MKKLIIYIFLMCMFAVPLHLVAQNDGDQVITVPKKYVSPEGLNHQAPPASVSAAADTTRWVGIGKEIGEATKQGLDAVVDSANKFGNTKVGNFVMIMIAWKIMGAELLGYIFRIGIGIPILISGVFVYIYLLKRMFFGYQVLDRIEDKTKIYKEHLPVDFRSHEARAMAACLTGLAFCVFVGVMLATIFLN